MRSLKDRVRSILYLGCRMAAINSAGSERSSGGLYEQGNKVFDYIRGPLSSNKILKRACVTGS